CNLFAHRPTRTHESANISVLRKFMLLCMPVTIKIAHTQNGYVFCGTRLLEPFCMQNSKFTKWLLQPLCTQRFNSLSTNNMPIYQVRGNCIAVPQQNVGEASPYFYAHAPSP